jgi:putative DNA primase/helicase
MEQSKESRDEKARLPGRANENSKQQPKNTTNDRGRVAVTDIADEIRAAEAFAHDRAGNIYTYSNGVYRRGGEKLIEQRVIGVLARRKASKQWTSHKGREAVAYIGLHCPALWDSPPSNLLNLENGLLDVKTHVLRPHRRDHFTTIQLPITFDPTAQSPAWDWFISEVFPADSHHIAYEIVALAMIPNRSLGRAVLLVGEGGNGKTTFLLALTSLLGGEENVSSLTLHQIESERFARAELFGKLANICADIPSDRLASTAMFKAITGGDHIMAEQKFRDPFMYRPFAKLIFSCNQPFTSHDDSLAFLQRWYVIPFDRAFRDTAAELPREELVRMLTEPTERSGVLNKALVVLSQVSSRGLDVTPTMDVAAGQFHRATNWIASWINENTVVETGAIAVKREVIDACKTDAVRDGRPPVSDKAFGHTMRTVRLEIESAQRMVEGQLKDVYVGLRLRVGRSALLRFGN